MFKEIKNFIGDTLMAVVPGLAMGIGIPGVASLAKAAITTVFGLPKKASIKKIEKAYDNMTPEQFDALGEAEKQFKLKMKEKDVDLEKLYTKQLQIAAQDTSGARKRELEMAKIGYKDDTPKTLAYLIVFGFFSFVIFAILKYTTIPAGMHDLLFLVIGILSSRMGQVFEYYFGTSSSSRKKDKALKDSVPIENAKELDL